MASNMQFFGVFLLYLCTTSSSLPIDPLHQNEQAHDYLRFADVNRQCQSVLSSATELTYDANRPGRVKRELSFEKGDWRQDAGHAPLLPFDCSDVPNDSRRLLDPLSLATFMLTHVDKERRAGTAVNVSGVLILTISRKSTAPEIGPHVSVSVVSPEFKLSPGSTKLKIIFEGVYAETAKANGEDDAERVLCMVGSAVLPTRSTDGADPWDWAKNSDRSSFKPPVTADNNILIVLRYPKELTLTTRAVLGEMRSTSAGSDAAYFDSVQLLSGLTSYCFYHFRHEERVAGACSPLPPGDANDVVANRARDRYNGSYFCDVLYRFAYGNVITVLPSWQCNSTATDAPCRSLGPFEMDRAADADLLAAVGIVMQDIRCEQQQGYDMTHTAGTVMLSAVFRVMSPWEDWYTAVQRSELSRKTLSAEGVWKASTGQACMVACRGIGNKACHFRVCLYIPTTFTITGRGILLGRITSINATGGAAHSSSLSFQQRMSPPRLLGYSGELPSLTYNYTKIKRAGEFLRRSTSPCDFRNIIAKSLPLLSYPKRDEVGDDRRSLSYLAGKLTLRFTAVPSLFPPEWIERPVLHLEIFSLGQLIEHHVPHSKEFSAPSSIPRKEPGSEGQLLLNVSAELTIFGKPRVTSSVMSLEGVYNPEDGRMYLIGCRDVRLPRRNLSTSRDLEEGMDCSIEVKVEYPPTTMHWFVRSMAKVQIASTRNAGDPLRFDTVKLQALPILYPEHWPSGLSRAIVNGVLCILLLSAAIAAALSQLRYLKSHADVAPYVSLVMLGVQALGYSMPLITGIEALLARATLRSDVAMPPSSSASSYMLDKSRLYQTIDQTVKILTLGAFVLTVRLGQKVWRSRVRMVARSPLEPWRVPSDAKVFVYHYGAHLVLFILILALNKEAMTVEQHVGLMQDLLLLPQVIGNAVWRVNCKPLKESYYLGVTAARLLPHVYDYVRPAAVDPYSDAYEFVNVFFSKAGDVVIPLTAAALALVVYVQQRWNYAIVSTMCESEQKKLQHIV